MTTGPKSLHCLQHRIKVVKRRQALDAQSSAATSPSGRVLDSIAASRGHCTTMPPCTRPRRSARCRQDPTTSPLLHGCHTNVALRAGHTWTTSAWLACAVLCALSIAAVVLPGAAPSAAEAIASETLWPIRTFSKIAASASA